MQEESTVTVPITKVEVPPSLRMPCHKPLLRGNTERDLIDHIIDLRESIDECNVRREQTIEVLYKVK